VTRFLLPADAFDIVRSAAAIDEEMGRLLTFLLYTGCRIGEALALKWETISVRPPRGLYRDLKER